MSCKNCEQVRRRVKARARAFASQVMARNAARKKRLQGKQSKAVV